MDGFKSNLEPIEESDLDLEKKIKSGGNFESLIHGEDEKPVFETEKEINQEISSAEKDGSYGKILSKVQDRDDSGADQGEVASDAATGASKTDAESQIQHLVDVAMQKGIVHAVKVAKHMEDYYVLDSFHDRLLSDEFHDALVKKGLIKEL